MTRFVGRLDREHLQHLLEVRVDAGDERRRDLERGHLVLDQVGHDLDDGVFDLVVVGDGRLPIDGRRRIPLRRGGLPVHPLRAVAPHLRAARDRVVERRTARLDERSARRESPRGIRMLEDRVGLARIRSTGDRTPVPSTHRRLAARHDRARAGTLHRMTLGPTPRHEADREVRIAPLDPDRLPDGDPAERALDEDLPTSIEPELAEVDDHHALARNSSTVPKWSTAAVRSSYPLVRPSLHALSPSRSRSGRTAGSS